MESKGIFDLTKSQQKAFNQFEKAYKKCLEEGIYFVNNYGSLQAYDSKIICGYGDIHLEAKGVSEVSNHDVGETSNEIIIPGEWADDQHYYGLTEKGHEIYFKKD